MQIYSTVLSSLAPRLLPSEASHYRVLYFRISPLSDKRALKQTSGAGDLECRSVGIGEIGKELAMLLSFDV